MEAKEEYTDDVFELESASPLKSGGRVAGDDALLSPGGFEESASITLPSPPTIKVSSPREEESEVVPAPPPTSLPSDLPASGVEGVVAAPQSVPGLSSEKGVGVVGRVEVAPPLTQDITGEEESKVAEESSPLATLISPVPAVVPAQPAESSSDGKQAETGDSTGAVPSPPGASDAPVAPFSTPIFSAPVPFLPPPTLLDTPPAVSPLPPAPAPPLPSIPGPSLPSDRLTVCGLAGALFSQFGAPPKARVEDGIKGWLEDTPTTGLLHLSLGDVMKRLCKGRPPLTRTTLESSLGVFLATCAEGSASVGSGAAALEGTQRIARCPLSVAHLPLIRMGVGETEASAARLLTLEEGGEEGEGKSDDDSPSGLAWVEYLATVGHLIPGLEGTLAASPPAGGGAAAGAPPRTPPPALSSTGEVGAQFSSASSTHSRLLSIASHLFRASPSKLALEGLHCALEATADAVTTGAGVGERRLARAPLEPLLRLPHGEELLTGVGWEIEGRDDPRGCLFLAKCGEEEEGGRSKLTSLVASLGELESHVTLIEGATPLSSLVRLTLTSKVINVDDQSMVEWLGKVLTAVRVVSHFTKVVVTSPHDPLLWRVPSTHPLFVAHCVKPFGEGVAWALLECGGFLHCGDAGVLKGSEGLNPAQCLAPLSLPTSPPPPHQGATEGGWEEEDESLALKLSSDTVDFALRRHEACEREAARLVRWYKKAACGGGGDTTAVQLPIDPCLPPPNPPPATIPILPGVPTGGAAGGGTAPTRAAGVPPPSAPTTAKKPAGKGGKGGGAPAGPPPDPLLSLELPPPGSEGSLVVAVLLKGGALNVDSGAAVFAEEAEKGGAGGGKKAPPAKKGGAAMVAHPPTHAELAIKVVEVTHPKFALQCAQLKHLRGAYLRLDKKSQGCAYRSDIAGAFAAEIRPLEERTDEYLDLWIRSRDLNRDGAVSWAEYAASFAPLFLPPGTGCDEVSVKEEGEKLAASAMIAATAAASGAAGGGKSKASAPKASSAAALPSDNLFIRDFQADQVAYEKALGVAGQVCSARRWVARELRVLAFAAMGQLEATVAGGHHLGAGSATAIALESAKVGHPSSGANSAPTSTEGQSPTAGGLIPTLPGKVTSPPPPPLHMSPGTFLSMPTAPGAIDTLCGLGLLHLFAGRTQARQLLRGITSHITSLVASPGDSRLWALKVVGGVRWGLEASSLTSGITRSTDCSIASEVVALPGVALLLRGVGFKGVVGKGGKGTIEEFRLPIVVTPSTPGSPSKAPLGSSLGKQGSPHLSRDTLDGLIMAATVLARHAVVYEAGEACDPAAVLLGVMALVTGSPPSTSGDAGGVKCLATLFREVLNAPPPPSPSSASDSTASSKGKAPAKGKGVVASRGPPPISDPVALAGPPTVGEAALDMDMAKKWCAGLEQLDKYLKVGERKVDTLTPSFQKFLTALPAGGVSTLHVVHPEDLPSASASTASLECCWPGVKFFTALGYREDPNNGHLVLPPPPHHLVVAAAAAGGGGGKGGEKSHSIIPPELTSRHLEVSSSLHFLKAVVHLSHKLHLWKDVKLPAMALKKAAEGRGGGVGGGGDGTALFSRVPTSLLTAVLDPRTALEKRYMESSSLRGGDATVGGTGGGDVASSSSSSLLLLDTSSASSMGGGGGGRPPLSAPPSLNSSFVSGGSGGAPPPHSAGALASLGPEEGAVALSRVMEEKEKLREAAASKISALESEVKELRATVRSHNVDELVPKLKASLVTLGKAEGGEEVKRSAVQAALGLGLPSSVSSGGGEVSTHPAGSSTTSRSSSVDKSKKDPKKAPSTNSARAALVSKDVITHSSVRTSTFTSPGSTQLLLRFFPEDMTINQQAAMNEEEVGMVQRGVSVIPSSCRLKGGDWILVGAQSATGFYAFVKRVKFGGVTADLATKDIIHSISGEVIEEEEAVGWGEEGASSAIAGDECIVLLDRPVPQEALPQDTFITTTHPDAESLKAFYRHELFAYLSNTLLPDIVGRAAQLAEVSVLAREAEAGYIHRTVTRRIPTALKLWGEEVSSPIPPLFSAPSASLSPDLSASGRLPATDNLTSGARGFPLLCSVGGSFFLSSDFAAAAATSQGDSPYPSLLPAKALLTPFSPLGGGGDVATHPHSFASPFSYAFDALDFGGVGALSLDAIVSRASQVPSVWSLFNSHSPLPIAPLTVLPSGASYAAANPTHTVGKGALGAPTSTPASIWRSLSSYRSQGHGELVVPRGLFACLFRPLHDLDWAIFNAPPSSPLFHFLSAVHPSAALGLTPIPSAHALPGMDFVRGEGDSATSVPGRLATASAFAPLSSHESLHPDAILASMSTGSALVMETGVTSEVVFSAYGPVEDLGDDDEEEGLVEEGEELEVSAGDENGAPLSHSASGDRSSSSLSSTPLSPRKRRALQAQSRALQKAALAPPPPPLRQNISIQGALALCLALDGDAPSLGEVRAALERYAVQVSGAGFVAVALGGGSTESTPSATPPSLGHVSLSNLYHFRCARDATLLSIPPSTLASHPLATQLAVARRSLYPTPGTARLQLVEEGLRGAFVALRERELTSGLKVEETGWGGASVEERVWSVSAGDLTRCLGETDAGRKVLSFPLGSALSTSVESCDPMGGLTMAHVLESLGRMSAHGHVNWVTLSSALHSGGRLSFPLGLGAGGEGSGPSFTRPLLPPLTSMATSSLHASLPDPTLFNSPSQGMTGYSAHTPPLVLDILPVPAASSIAVLTSDGVLTSWCTHTLTRRWATPALPPAAAAAFALTRSRVTPSNGGGGGKEGFLVSGGASLRTRLLSTGMSAPPPPSRFEESGPGVLPTTQCHAVILLNACPVGVAWESEANGTGSNAAMARTSREAWLAEDPLHSLNELLWFSDSPSSGTLAARCSPRFIGETPLPPDALFPLGGGQGALIVPSGTHTVLLETLYLADAHLVFALSVLPGHHTDHEDGRVWPRVLALCGLTGAVVGDLGVLHPRIRDAWGCHLTYNATSRHLLVADATPTGAPILRVYDVSPLFSALSRSRSAFMGAAGDPGSVGGVAAAATASLSSSFALNESSATPNSFLVGVEMDALVVPQSAGRGPQPLRPLFPRVLPLPPSALLDLSFPFTPSVSFNPEAPPTSSLCLLETTGMLAVAGWDGRVSLWDTTHVRHRLLYPPSSPPSPLHLNLELPAGRKAGGIGDVCEVTLDAATDTLGDLKHAAAKVWCEAQQVEEGGLAASFAPPFTLFSRTRGVELAPYPDTTPLRSLVDHGDSVVIEVQGPTGYNTTRSSSSPAPTPPPSLIDQDSGWTAVPTGCHIVSTLPLCTYYKPAGVLNSASGRLSRSIDVLGGGGEKGGYHTSPVNFSAVGLASICLTPQGLSSRPPSKIHTPESALAAAEFISQALLGGLQRSGEDTAKVRSPRSGYIYLLDDGTVLSAEPPSSSPTFDPRWITLDDDALFLTMASSGSEDGNEGGVSLATVDTLRRVSLARDKLVRVFYVVSKSGIPCASLHPAVARTFVLSSGVVGGGTMPLSMPTAGCPLRVLLKEIAAAHDSACGGSGDAMGSLSAMESLSVLFSSSRTPLTPEKLASALSSSTPLMVVPFFTPGDSPGTLAPLVPSPSSAAPSSHPSLGAPHVNPGAYAFDGGYWTTGVVVEAKPSITAVVTVALEGEERRVAVSWDSVQVLKRSQGSVIGLNFGLGAVTQRASPPYPGDVVALRVQSASTVVESGGEEFVTGTASPSVASTSLGPAHGAWYPPCGEFTPLLSNAGLGDGGGRQHPFNPICGGTSNPSTPHTDILALALDWGSPGCMHRRLEMWGVSRGSIVCPVHEYDKDEGVWGGGGDSTDVAMREDALQLYEAVDSAFQGAIPGYFLGGCAGWIGANAVGLRRQIWRERGTIGDARELYSRAAASSLASGGVNATAWALLNTIQSSSAREEASRLPALRHTLGYVWALCADMDRRGVFKAWATAQEEGRVLAVTSHLNAAAMEGGRGEDAGEELDSSHFSLPSSSLALQGTSLDGLPLSPLLSVILTAAWHFPLLRYHLRYLFSLPAPSSTPPSSFTPPSVLHIPTTAAAAMPVLSRLLSQSRDRGTGGDSLDVGRGEASNPFRRISLDVLLAAATTVASKAPLLESLLPTLGYLRAGAGSKGVPVTEHMVDALIRRRVLPWDPPTLLSLGVGDPETVAALCLSAPVAQPLESHTTGEIVFLLADAPSVSSVNLPGLSALASTFADPMSALRATMALLTSAADTLHYRLKARVSGAKSSIRGGDQVGSGRASGGDGAPSTSAMFFASHSRFAGLVASAFSPSITPTFAKSVRRAMAAKVAASEASVSLKALMETKSATRLALYNRMNSKGNPFSPGLSQLPGSLYETGGETAGEMSARRALARESVLLRARALLKGSPKSVSLSTGRDESWVSAFVDCAAVFTASAAGYARESPRVWGGAVSSSSAATFPSPSANLTALLSSGGIEALVSAAVIHTHLVLSLPGIRSSGVDIATPLAAVLGAIDALISVCERDTIPGAGRMAPHLPRLLRALVHAATGRLNGISEDAEGVGEDGVGSSSAKGGSQASEAGGNLAPLLQPAYVSLSVSIFTPVLRRLFGPTGSGAHTIPALRRYISNCGTVAALGRGVEAGAAAAVSHVTMGGAGGLLTVLVEGPFLQPFSPYLTGLTKAASLEAQASLTARNALEAGQQSLCRHFASASFQHTVKSFLDRYRGVAVGGRDAKHLNTASSRQPLLLKLASQGSAQLTSPYSSFRRGPAYWGSLLSALSGVATLHEGCPDPIADATPKGGSAGMGSHVRLLERTTSRRAAASRIASVLTPPFAFSFPCPLLAGLSGGGGGSSGREEGGNAEDVEVDDCDRALLAMDLSLPDFTAALMMDPDPTTRATAFRASRNLSLAVAWPGMVDWYKVGNLEEGASEEDFHVETTPGMSRSTVHFSSAVRERAWGRLLLRFSSTDCVLAAAKVCLQHCSWAKGGPDANVSRSGKTVNTALPPPDSPDTVASAIDLFAASVGGRTVLPSAWRAVGVSRALTRLVRMGFGKLKVSHPSSSKSGGGQGGAPLDPPFVPTSLLDALLVRLVTDTVTNEYLAALFKHDGPTRAWGSEVGLLAVSDIPETWPQLVGVFQSALVTLEVSGVLDVVSIAKGETLAPSLSSLQASMDGHHTLANHSWKGVGGQDRRSEMFGLENGGVRGGETKGRSEGSLQSTSLAEKLASTLSALLPLAPTLKRLLGIEIETLIQGFIAASVENAAADDNGMEEEGGEDSTETDKPPSSLPYDTELFNGGMGALWALGEAAWTLILSTHPNAHALRRPAYTFCHLLLSIVSWGASQGPLTAAITLGCPPDEPPTGAVWPGLAALVRWGGGCSHIAFRANTADGGAWRVSTRALGVLGEVLSGAVGVVGVEAVEEEVIGRVVQSALIAKHAKAANEGGVVEGEGGGRVAGASPSLHPTGSKVWLERGYALSILAQSCDAGVVEAHAQSCVATTELFEWAESAKNVGLHCFAGKGGEAYATGVPARSLLWASICRAALLKPPPSTNPVSLPQSTSQLPSVSAAFAAHIMHCDAPRYAVSRMLPCPILLTSGGSSFCPPSLQAYENTYAPRCEGASLLTTFGVLVTAARAKSEGDSQVDAAAGVMGGFVPPSQTAGSGTGGSAGGGGAFASQSTSFNTTSASGMGLTPWEGALRALGPGEPTLSSPHPSPLAPLHSLSEYIVGVIVSEGVVGRERSRLWSVRDVAYAPTVPFVLQALLWCCPQSEALKGALNEMDTPMAAFEWVVALSRLWKAACVGRSMAAASTRASAKAASVEGGKPAIKFDHTNLGSGLTALRGEYIECEKAAGVAWARWRAFKLGLAPTAGEIELGKGFEGALVPPATTSLGATSAGSRGAHVSPPLLPLPRGGLGPGGGIPRAAEVALGTVLLSSSSHRSHSSGRSFSQRPAAAPPTEAPSAPPVPPLPPTPSTASATSSTSHLPSGSLKRATPISAKSNLNSKASPVRSGKSLGGAFSLVPFGGPTSSTAVKRPPTRDSFTVSALAQGAPTLVPPPPPLEATNLALQVIGEGIVAVKALFYAQAVPCARGGEAAVTSDTPTLKRLISGLGIPPPEEPWFETARRAHVLPSAPGAPLPFAPFLRFVSSVMVEQGMNNLGGGEEDTGGEFDFGDEGGDRGGMESTPHFTSGAPSPFLASAVHRSALPPIPHPGSEALSKAIGEAGGVIHSPQALSAALSSLGVSATSEEIKEVYAMLSLHEKAVIDVDALTVCFKTLAGWKAQG